MEEKPELGRFTKEEHEELARLKHTVQHGRGGPDFPWGRYRDLLLVEKKAKLIATMNSLLGVKNSAVEARSLGQLQTNATPRQTSKDVSSPARIEMPVPTLESICKGEDNKRKLQVAQAIDGIWEVVSKNTAESKYPALCVALYKVGVMLGKVENQQDVSASTWRRVLEVRYGVPISNGIAKYNILNPKSEVFVKAVRDVYAFISRKYPLWVRGVDLPPIYR